MEKKKSYGLLIAGAVLLIAGIILAVFHYNNSYQESVAVGNTLKEVKAQIAAINDGTATGDLETLKAQQTSLSDEKLSLERPYSYSLALVFLSVLLTNYCYLDFISIRQNLQLIPSFFHIQYRFSSSGLQFSGFCPR